MRVEIMNWDKFNPRRDVKSTSWLRLQNTFWQDHKFFELDNDGKMVWIALLSTASQEQKGMIEINPDLIGAVLKVSSKKVKKVLEILEKKQCVRISDELRDVDVPTRTDERTDERTNGTNGTDTVSGGNAIAPFELFDLWNQKSGSLPKIEKLTDARHRKVKARIKEHPDESFWDNAIGKAVQVFDQVPKDEWRFSFDNLIHEEKLTKLMEGGYDFLKTKHNKRQKTFADLKSEGNAEIARMAREGAFDEFER
jgi:hypothetical protein